MNTDTDSAIVCWLIYLGAVVALAISMTMTWQSSGVRGADPTELNSGLAVALVVLTSITLIFGASALIVRGPGRDVVFGLTIGSVAASIVVIVFAAVTLKAALPTNDVTLGAGAFVASGATVAVAVATMMRRWLLDDQRPV